MTQGPEGTIPAQENPMKGIARAFTVLKYFMLFTVISVTLALTWLRWESGLPKDVWFSDRHGQIAAAVVEDSITQDGQQNQSVQLESNSGLRVSFRVIRNAQVAAPQPVMMVLGGHRTGSGAVDLFGDVGSRVIVGIDYPYDGPQKVQGVTSALRAIPSARQAVLDTVPAVSLILDWLVTQEWVDQDKIIVIGASLGVPFAATAAARDERIAGLMLVHGAADNRRWLEVQVARRVDSEISHYPLATVLYWLAYGPVFDTKKYVAMLSPRPLLIVGARNDERTPGGETEVLFANAREPKRLRFTEGRHIQPNRTEIIGELLKIADEELAFLTQ
jgi:dienelactone hydrolase